MNLLEEIGAQIRVKRKQMGYSQELLGKLVAMDKTQISKIEHGKYKNIEIIENVLETLNVGIFLREQEPFMPIGEPVGDELPPLDISETIFRDYVPGHREINSVLLWDMDIDKYDFEKGYKLAIQRTIERGLEEDYYAAFDRYGGFDGFRQKLMDVPELSDRDINYVNICFRIPKTQLKCYTQKRSRQALYPY